MKYTHPMKDMMKDILLQHVADSYFSAEVYTRSPLQDSRLFGPRPWKILAATYEQEDY